MPQILVFSFPLVTVEFSIHNFFKTRMLLEIFDAESPYKLSYFEPLCLLNKMATQSVKGVFWNFALSKGKEPYKNRQKQNPKYWRAKECSRLQNKTQLTRKVWFFFVYISQWSLITFFALQYFVFCTMWSPAAKDLLVEWLCYYRKVLKTLVLWLYRNLWYTGT